MFLIRWLRSNSRRIAALEALAEKAFDERYEARFPAGLFGEVTAFFALAIAAASEGARAIAV